MCVSEKERERKGGKKGERERDEGIFFGLGSIQRFHQILKNMSIMAKSNSLVGTFLVVQWLRLCTPLGPRFDP